MATRSLASLGSQILAEFDKVLAPNVKNLLTIDEYEIVQYEGQRFAVWANSLGLHHDGHSSLDYRLKDSDKLCSYVCDLLGDLVNSLKLCEEPMSILNSMSGLLMALISVPESVSDAQGQDLDREHADDESAKSEEFSDESSDPHVIVSELTDIIDRLYKFATQIRNPRTRIRSDKIQKHCQYDTKTGVDLIQVFRDFDKKHVREIFLNREREASRNTGESREVKESSKLRASSAVKEEHKDTNASTQVSTPRWELTGDDEILISRLALANTYRRQQFGHWKKHAEKYSNETVKALNDRTEIRSRTEPTPSHLRLRSSVLVDAENTTNTMSKASTATAILNPGDIKLDDGASTTSKMTASPRPLDSKDDDIEIPDPPKVQENDKHFKCPYCFLICPVNTRKPSAWRSVNVSRAPSRRRIPTLFVGNTFFEISVHGFVLTQIVEKGRDYMIGGKTGLVTSSGYTTGSGAAHITRIIHLIVLKNSKTTGKSTT